MGDFIVKNVTGTLIEETSDNPNKRKYASQYGYIGYKLLSRFNLLVDYPKSTITLVKPDQKLKGYNLKNWISIPLEKTIFSKIKIGNQWLTIGWDTGAAPSVIKQSVAHNFKQTPCYQTHDTSCSLLMTPELTASNGAKLPGSWFIVQKLPKAMPFDALFGSNFFHSHLVYFDFSKHKVYVENEQASK